MVPPDGRHENTTREDARSVPASTKGDEMTLTLEQYEEIDAGDDLSAAVERFLRAQLRTGGWHPEDDPADQSNVRTGEPTFTPDAAVRVESDIRRIYAAGLDACGLCLAAFPSHMGVPTWHEDGYR